MLWHDPADGEPTYSQIVELDLATVEPSLAGPAAAAGPRAAARREGVVPRCPPHLRRRLRHGRGRCISRELPGQRPHSPGRARPRGVAGDRHGGRSGRRRALGGGLVRARRRALSPRPRRRRDRRHHELHEHVEPAGDGRRRAAREEGGRARPAAPSVGEVEPRAGVEGRHAVPRRGRPHAPSRRARLPDGRLRLHDVHRQLGAAAGRDLAGDRRGRPRRRRACCPGTGTSRRASTRRSRPTTSRRRRSSSRTRSPAAWTSTSSTSRSAPARTARTCTSRTSGPACRRCRT